MKLSKITTASFEFDGAVFEFKHLLSGDVEEIADKVDDSRLELSEAENGEYVPVRTMRTKKAVERELIFMKAVTGWSGEVLDQDETPLEYSEANKRKLIKNLDPVVFRELMTALNEERAKLAGLIQKQREESRKN